MLKKNLTIEQLKKNIEILDKKIKKAHQQIVKPFIPMILKAHKTGKLDQLHEAFALIVNGTNQEVKPETAPETIVTDETMVVDSPVESPEPDKKTKLVIYIFDYRLIC